MPFAVAQFNELAGLLLTESAKVSLAKAEVAATSYDELNQLFNIKDRLKIKNELAWTTMGESKVRQMVARGRRMLLLAQTPGRRAQRPATLFRSS